MGDIIGILIIVLIIIAIVAYKLSSIKAVNRMDNFKHDLELIVNDFQRGLFLSKIDINSRMAPYGEIINPKYVSMLKKDYSLRGYNDISFYSNSLVTTSSTRMSITTTTSTIVIAFCFKDSYLSDIKNVSYWYGCCEKDNWK